MEAEANGDVLWIRGDGENHQDDVWDDTALIDAYDRAVGQVKEEIAKRKNETSGTKKKNLNRSKPSKTTWKVGDYCNTIYPEDGAYYEAYIKEMSESGDKCLIQFIGYGNEIVTSILALKPSLGKAARDQQEVESQQTIPEFQESNVAGAAMDWAINSTEIHRKIKSHSCSPNSQPARNSSRQSFSSQTAPHSHTSMASHCFQSMPHQPPTPPPMSWPGSHYTPPHRMHVPPIPPPPAFPLDQDIVNDEEALAAMLMSWYMSGYHTGYYQGLRQSQTCQTQPECRKFQAACNCCIHSTR